MDEETLQRRDKAIHEATELLKRANDILGCFIETKIPELVIKVDKEYISSLRIGISQQNKKEGV